MGFWFVVAIAVCIALAGYVPLIRTARAGLRASAQRGPVLDLAAAPVPETADAL